MTFTMAATPYLYDVVQLDGLQGRELSSFRYLCQRGHPFRRPLVRQAYQKLPCKILSGWGQSENGLFTVTMSDDSVEKLTGTDGCPFGELQIQTVDEQEVACPPNVEGNLWARGATNFVGYLNNENYTRSQFRDDWFITGDAPPLTKMAICASQADRKTRLYAVGKTFRWLMSKTCCTSTRRLAVAQIVAMPDIRLQERACAFVSMKPNSEPLTLASMQAFLEQQGVTRHYWPERLEIVEAFPRTPSGKVQKYRLREIIAEKLRLEAGNQPPTQHRMSRENCGLPI